MANSKNKKILKSIGLVTGGLAILATPIIATACNTQSNNSSNGQDQKYPDGNIIPVIKDNFDLQASFPTIVGANGTKSEIENNLNLIANENKNLLIENFDRFSEQEKNQTSIEIKVLEGDDKVWGTQEFNQWGSDVSLGSIKYWNGSNESKNKNEKIIFSSMFELKKFINDNIQQISKNINIIKQPNNEVRLADAKIIFDHDENALWIPMEINNESHISKNYKSFNRNKFILSIPQMNLLSKIPLDVNIQIGSNEVHNKLFFEGPFETIVEQKEVNYLDDANLIDKGTIQLYQELNNYDILRALGWVKEKINGYITDEDLWISSTLLEKEKMIDDLKLSQDDDILSIKLYVEERNVTSNNFKGNYHFDINVASKKSESKRTEYKRYSYYSKLGVNNKNVPLKVLVPNSYVLDTIISSVSVNKQNINDSNNYKYIDKNFIGASFVMGSKKMSTVQKIKGIDNGVIEDNETKIIEENLRLKNTFNKFINAIKQKKEDDFNVLFNYVNLSLIDVKKHKAISEGQNIVISFNVEPKEGYTFKNSFSVNSKKYNSENRTTILRITVSCGNDDSKTIKFDPNKTPNEINDQNSEI